MFSNLIGAKKTVAGVLSVFSKAIADLETVEREQSAEAEAHAIAEAQAQAGRRAAILEAASARIVIEKMKIIINPTGIDFRVRDQATA